MGDDIMKKMLVSDYDQTLHFDTLTFYFNLRKINQFRENNNLFVLSTGRNYKSIMAEIIQYNIPYDYLSCSNGAELYDRSNKLVYASYIDKIIIDYLELVTKDTNLIKSINKTGAYNQKAHDQAINCLINFSSLESLKQINTELKETYRTIETVKWLKSLLIYNTGVNKSLTIEKIKEIEKVEDDNIFTIGDHNNDVSMVRDYNGFNMLWATRKVREHSLKGYLTVGQLIDDINTERAKIRIKK
jgi:hydroxymethylpyrimidine pyrophosphatase-like HAD family hydrolase